METLAPVFEHRQGLIEIRDRTVARFQQFGEALVILQGLSGVGKSLLAYQLRSSRFGGRIPTDSCWNWNDSEWIENPEEVYVNFGSAILESKAADLENLDRIRISQALHQAQFPAFLAGKVGVITTLPEIDLQANFTDPRFLHVGLYADGLTREYNLYNRFTVDSPGSVRDPQAMAEEIASENDDQHNLLWLRTTSELVINLSGTAHNRLTDQQVRQVLGQRPNRPPGVW